MIIIEIRGFGKRPPEGGGELMETAKEVWGNPASWYVAHGEQMGLVEPEERALTMIMRVKRCVEKLPFLDEIIININSIYAIHADGRGSAPSMIIMGIREETEKIEQLVEMLHGIPCGIGLVWFDKVIEPAQFAPKRERKRRVETEARMLIEDMGKALYWCKDEVRRCIRSMGQNMVKTGDAWGKWRHAYQEKGVEELTLEIAKKDRHVRYLASLVIYLLWWIAVNIKELPNHFGKDRKE